MSELIELHDSHKKLQPLDAKFTYSRENAASRIDRIYVSVEFSTTSAEVKPNQFSAVLGSANLNFKSAVRNSASKLYIS